jgi:hypothetical protein
MKTFRLQSRSWFRHRRALWLPVALLALVSAAQGQTDPGFRLSSPSRTITGEPRAQLAGKPAVPYLIEGSVDLTNWFRATAVKPASALQEITLPELSELGTLFLRAKVTAENEVPNPLNTVAVPNPKVQVTKLISDAGGTLSLTNTDGTVATLTIPAGALISDEKISMTWVSSIDGFPFTPPATAAIQLGPDQLQFLEPVTLQFTTPQPVDPAELIGFGYFDTGSEFHAYPQTVEGRTITFLLSHFSGYGAGRASAAQRGAQQQRAPKNSGARAAQNGVLPPAVDLQARAVERLMQSVLPLLRAAAQSESLLETAFAEYLSWRAMPGVDWSQLQISLQLARNALAAAIKNATDVYYDRCVKNHDPFQAANLLRWYRIATQLGLWDRAGLDQAVVKDNIKKCPRFELDVDCRITGSTTDQNIVTHVVVTGLEIQISDDFKTFAGSKALTYKEFSFAVPGVGCTGVNVVLDGGKGIASGSFFNLNYKGRKPPQIFLGFYPTLTREQYSIACPGFPAIPSPMDGHFRAAYTSFHGDQMPPIGPGIDDWTFIGGANFARRVFTDSLPVDGGVYQEQTTFLLRHTPH